MNSQIVSSTVVLERKGYIYVRCCFFNANIKRVVCKYLFLILSPLNYSKEPPNNINSKHCIKQNLQL